MSELRIALIQTNAGLDMDANLAQAERLIERAAEDGARVVVAPENFHMRIPAGSAHLRLARAEDPGGPFSRRFGALAKRLGIYLLAGSYNEKASDPQRMRNTSLFFGPSGELLARYHKVHMFDVAIQGHIAARESASVEPGSEFVTAPTEFGTVGLSICYDLRFPELYRALAVNGARLVFVPANFALFTGRDHWEVLLRARAIENGVFVAAAGQIGGVEGAFQSYGRSMVVDPWGTVVACASDGQEIVHATIDLGLVERVRERLPGLEHRRPDVYGDVLAARAQR